ncbi:uncharacterized protein LOC135462911 isoform X1 [Liolophura sinensis]|uniref:uncharacterized protein LOC135462911 isoform X1 n=1 Tax=Liolophura sinensis TaxID=3198878 RepID=UPI003158B8A1
MASRPMASPGMTSQCVLSSCCVLVVILKQSLSEAATISTDVSLPMNTSENVTVNETFEMATQEQFTNTTSGSTAATIASSTVVTNSTQDVEDHEDYTGVIVGSSVAGGLGVVLVTVCICCLIRSRLKVRRKQPSISTIYNTTDG